MELVTGAMGTLLPKMSQLLSEDYKLQKSVRDNIMFLQRGMASMEAFLVKVAEVPTDQLDVQIKFWADEVREVSYVLEDSIDRFMLSIRNASNLGLQGKTIALLKKDTPRHRIAVDIIKLKKRVLDASEWRDRFRADEAIHYPSATTTVDPRVHALYADPAKLVGVDKSRHEIFELLTLYRREHDWVRGPLKILSIFGFPGVGKTTLANVVYDGLRGGFDVTAFVPVGPNPDLKRVLKEILLQINRGKYSDASTAAAATADERNCIDEIRHQLQREIRYLIVVDDIWDTKTWEIIRWAFIDCKCDSRVIITTRNYEVAARAGGVYKLEPLSLDDSETLLSKRLLDSQYDLDDQTTQLMGNILQKCGGVPLAIITIATLFSGKPKEHWYRVYDSIDWAAGNEAVEQARRIILFSYYDLPIHLRVCLLHLSIFPKNYMIRKDTLIWKWIAEGFIPENPRAGLFEMGEECFNELINRNMIQPVEISHNGDIIGCRVHDMVVDIICSMAKGAKFVALLNDNKEQYGFVQSNARRFALHGKVMEEQYFLADTDMPIVRSFNAIRCDTNMMPSLESFKLLRVLAIEDCSTFELKGNDYLLEHIGKLLLLRYLGLSKSPVSKLPEEVGNLKFLEILDVRQTGIRELPRSVSLLSRLKCLRADGGSTRVPDWIGNLTSLEELSLSDVSSCPNFVKEVSKLTMLRELKIWIRVLDGRSKNALVKSLSNLQKIQVLHLNGGLLIEEAEWEGYVPPRQLRRLSLRIKSVGLPRWINSSLLPTLSHLSADLRVVEADDLEILGSFPGLISLELFTPNRVSLDIKGCDAFPKLRHCYSSGMLSFLEGAAPCLESVHFNVMLALNGASFDFSFLEERPLLKEVRVEIFYSDVHADVEVEQKLRSAVGYRRVNLYVSQYKIVL